jgi:hypothetical protein
MNWRSSAEAAGCDLIRYMAPGKYSRDENLTKRLLETRSPASWV